MRGGPGHDTMHGAFGDDLMNGDSGGDTLFGDDGADVMWGGKGRKRRSRRQPATDRGTNDSYVDYLFGGHGGDPKNDAVTGGADILDFRPRPGIDPASWFDATNTNPSDPVADHQHHQGIDWIYGGWDRDVMQGDVADNGPNPGDRLLDWTGAYNLYTHCNAAYGGYNDVRQFSPAMQTFLQQLAYGSARASHSPTCRPRQLGVQRARARLQQGHEANSGSATRRHRDTSTRSPARPDRRLRRRWRAARRRSPRTTWAPRFACGAQAFAEPRRRQASANVTVTPASTSCLPGSIGAGCAVNAMS